MKKFAHLAAGWFFGALVAIDNPILSMVGFIGMFYCIYKFGCIIGMNKESQR